MSDPINSGPDSSGPRARQAISASNQAHSTGWPVVLVFSCIALGFTASAADYERIAANSERNHAELLATECSNAEGQLEDLGKFLADPHTQLVPLTRSGRFAANPAMIAWNPVERHGYFLCDHLPVFDAGQGYQLWALRGMDDPAKLATLDAKPGISVYPFRLWQGMVGKMRLEITAGARLADKSPAFAGDIE